MSELMCLQTSAVSKGLLVLSALEGLCASVSELMCLEMSTPVKGLVTLSALVRLLSAVDSHVVHKVMLPDK